jgi:hypothetical protein
MRDYFKRLKSHPGLGIAGIMTVLGAFAGASNESFQNPLHGALFGIILVGLFVWLPVLLSNRK